MITIDMEVPIYLTLNEVNTEYVQDELLKTALEFVQGCQKYEGDVRLQRTVKVWADSWSCYMTEYVIQISSVGITASPNNKIACVVNAMLYDPGLSFPFYLTSTRLPSTTEWTSKDIVRTLNDNCLRQFRHDHLRRHQEWLASGEPNQIPKIPEPMPDQYGDW